MSSYFNEARVSVVECIPECQRMQLFRFDSSIVKEAVARSCATLFVSRARATHCLTDSYREMENIWRF